MHWCMDETLAVLAMIPFIGYFFRKLHIWWHNKIHHTCHEKHCDAEHAEHSMAVTNEQPSFMLTLRGVIVGAIIHYGPMTHEQLADLLSGTDYSELYQTINQLVEEGALVLDGDFLKEGNIFHEGS